MRQTLIALLSGIGFGAGLELAGMTNPAKIQNFLDVFGHWDPSLAVVMGGALAISAPATWLARRRGASWLAGVIGWPSREDFDPRLLVGSAIFGVGWGLAGFCPGPALSNLYRGDLDILVFVAAMAIGMGLYALWNAAPSRQAETAPPGT